MNKAQLDAKAGNGAVINITFFDSDTQPAKGIVIIIHGFGEHSGSYDELAHHLSQAGYSSAIYNQRGHGVLRAEESGKLKEESGQSIPKRTAGGQKDMRGIIPSYQCFLDDISAVTATVKLHAPDLPITLYGHSMGGNIVANYLLKNDQSAYICAVLEAPWLGLYKEVSPLVAGLAKAVGRLTPKVAIFNKLSPDDVTGDPDRADVFRTDPLYHNRISMRMFAGINDGCKYALSNASKLAIPVYLAAAGNDRIVSTRATTQFAEEAGSIATFKLYDSFHAIHNDTQREGYYRDVIDYLDKHYV